jgi:hypothetical protein
MALRWASAAMQEAAKGFRRLKAYKQLPLLQAALAVRKARATSSNAHLAQTIATPSLDSPAGLLFSSQRAASIEHVLEKLLRCFGSGIFQVFEFECLLSDKQINVIGKHR